MMNLVSPVKKSGICLPRRYFMLASESQTVSFVLFGYLMIVKEKISRMSEENRHMRLE